MKRLTIPFIMLIVLYSCTATKYSSPESCNCQQVIISEGGGISGQTTQTIIIENGQVFERTILPAGLKELKTISKKSAAEIFDRSAALKLSDMDFNHPGNMTYSVGIRNGSDFYEVKWGDPAFQVPENIRDFYKYVRQQTTTN